jgi:hypothetical protein
MMLCSLFDTNDRRSTFLQNFSKLLPDYTVAHLRIFFIVSAMKPTNLMFMTFCYIVIRV